MATIFQPQHNHKTRTPFPITSNDTNKMIATSNANKLTSSSSQLDKSNDESTPDESGTPLEEAHASENKVEFSPALLSLILFSSPQLLTTSQEYGGTDDKPSSPSSKDFAVAKDDEVAGNEPPEPLEFKGELGQRQVRARHRLHVRRYRCSRSPLTSMSKCAAVIVSILVWQCTHPISRGLTRTLQPQVRRSRTKRAATTTVAAASMMMG